MYNEGIDYTAGGEKMTVSKVAIASDHGGIELRKSIISYLESVGISYEEFGPETPESVDYPGLAITVSEKVVNQEVDRGILVCGTGIGMSIAANKVKVFVARLLVIHLALMQRVNIMIQMSLRLERES